MTPTLRGTWTVATFETKRSVTLARAALWLVLAGFPISIVSIVYFSAREQINLNNDGPQIWQLLILGLTQVMVALSVLLWASPALQVELENRTWIYTSTRPYGRRCILLGRYAVAVLWASSANVVSVLVCCFIAGVQSAAPALLGVTLLSCFAYASLFCLLAVMFPRRAMSVAFGLTLLLELVVSFIPAMIHNVSIEYHLRCLLGSWIWQGTRLVKDTPMIFSGHSPWLHVFSLTAYSIILLAVAILVVESRELPTDEL